MFLLLIIVVRICSSTVVRHKVSYQYLATRTRLTSSENMDDITSIETQTALANYCQNETCFSAVFRKPGMQWQYQLLLDTPYDWRVDLGSLSFTEAEYNYSIVFLNDHKFDQSPGCSEKSGLNSRLKRKFRSPVCDTQFNNSFVRENGRTWCYMLELNKDLNFTDATEKCHSWKAELNGFQSEEERNYFINNVEKSKTQADTYYIFLGARRNFDCINSTDQTACASKHKLEWINNVSTNQSLANDQPEHMDGNGDCLSYFHNVGDNKLQYMEYNDMPCNNTIRYSCGKYADYYP